MNIPSNGFLVNTGAPLPFAPPPPGAAPIPVAPTDSWTPSAAPVSAPAYQMPAYQPQTAAAPAREEGYQFACFRPENWTYPSTLTNNTYKPAGAAGAAGTADPRLTMMRQREDAFNQNRRNMAAGWNNYSRNIVDPNRGFGQDPNAQYGGFNAQQPGSYMYGAGNQPGMRRPYY